MKKSLRYLFALLALVLAANLISQKSFAFADDNENQSKPIKSNIGQILIPSVGYDDNDNIQVVIDGHVPNICYSATQPEFSLDKEKRIITIIQNAAKKPIQGCSDEDLATGALLFPVSFTNVLDLGSLTAGEYLITASGDDGKTVQRKFTVEKAPLASVDNSLYAPIKSAFIPDMIYETPRAELVISGVLDSPCMRLRQQDVEVKKHGDVIVVLPKLTLRNTAACTYNPRPLQMVVPLGSLSKGRYLIHIRTITGGAINRVFSVIERGSADNRRHL